MRLTLENPNVKIQSVNMISLFLHENVLRCSHESSFLVTIIIRTIASITVKNSDAMPIYKNICIIEIDG